MVIKGIKVIRETKVLKVFRVLKVQTVNLNMCTSDTQPIPMAQE
jgi:hypothetical protein